MKTPKEKALELVDKMASNIEGHGWKEMSKECALIAVENEYKALREQLFNLRSTRVIESEKVYLFRVQELIDKEQELKNEIKNL